MLNPTRRFEHPCTGQVAAARLATGRPVSKMPFSIAWHKTVSLRGKPGHVSEPQDRP